jgi:hypothetical protein
MTGVVLIVVKLSPLTLILSGISRSLVFVIEAETGLAFLSTGLNGI